MRQLKEIDFMNSAKLLEVEPEVIKAVARVEAQRGGFTQDGRPIILFEGHVFHKFLKYKGLDVDSLVQEYPSIVYPKWTKKYYLGYDSKRIMTPRIDDEYERLAIAQTIDNESALKSCSWGKFQIMGFNFKKCNYDTVFDFVYDMQKSEREHLIAFCNFIINRGLKKYLQEKNWTKFAYYYNGESYYKNNYDLLLGNAYWHYKRYS